MKVVKTMSKVDEVKCKGCKTCEKVCPVLAVTIEDKRARVNVDLCTGCGFCEQRCPEHAIYIMPRESPKTIGVSPKPEDHKRIADVCFRAKFFPEQVVCYCTGTRADEVVAAILMGAQSPEAISAMTGARTGCGVLCIQNILRLLYGAGIEPKPPAGHQWYGKPITIWDLSEFNIERYTSFGNRILEDRQLIEHILNERKRRFDNDSSH